MPPFPVPGRRDRGVLAARRRSSAGLRQPLPGGVPDDRRAQADYEVGVIMPDGLPGLLPRRRRPVPARASENGIRVGPGRGSAAGSMVAYALGITELDPIEHRLLFERFLNPERISMPDIDLDFDERRRGDMIRYATETLRRGAGRADHHLRHHQGEAGDQGLRAGARLPVRDGRPDHQGMPPPVMGKDMPLAGIFDPSTRALQARPASSGRSTRPTPTSRGSSTPRAGSRA